MLQILAAALFFIPLRSSRAVFGAWAGAMRGRIVAVSLLVVYGWMYLLLWGVVLYDADRRFGHCDAGPGRYADCGPPAPSAPLPAGTAGRGACRTDRGGNPALQRRLSTSRTAAAPKGIFFVLLAVVAIAVNTVLIKPQLERLGTLVVMGWYYIIGLAVTAPFFWRYISHTDFLRLPLSAQAELAYILILGTVLPMYLLYRGTEKLTSVHTALYRYIQPLTAGLLAVTRGQAHFNAVNLTAAGFIFTGGDSRGRGVSLQPEPAQRRPPAALFGREPTAPGVGNGAAALDSGSRRRP